MKNISHISKTMRLTFTLVLLFLFSIANSQSNNIKFAPTKFYNAYDSRTAPVLTINPGDTIHTETLDAGGWDKDSVKRGERGNPLTGPFFITGAEAGDIIAVTFVKLTLNRNFATTLNTFIPKIIPEGSSKKMWRDRKLVKWNLDLVNNYASPVKEYDHLSSLKIPLHPFLGSVSAASPGTSAISSGGFGAWGGNLDCRFVAESSTLYLPINHNGALLYFGDGHAAQGDGELNGDALETSMNVSFTVRLIKNNGQQMKYPRIEDSQYIIAFGQANNLDEALEESTLNLVSWLQQDYKLSAEEASQVIGPSVEYRIPKIAAKEVEVVAMIKKTILATIKPANDSK